VTPLTFDILGIPAPQGSKRHLGHGILVESSKRVKPWRTDIQQTALSHKPPDWHHHTPITITLTFRFPRPKSHFSTKGTLKPSAPQHLVTRTGDIDKLARATLDALTGILFADDAQVIALTAHKRYTIPPELPGALITVIPHG
jgi:crossover junction endodeoxyribonuclease RusA